MEQVRGTKESQNEPMENINDLKDNKDKQITHFEGSEAEMDNKISEGGNTVIKAKECCT
jgi:hypothetical protein